MADIDEIFTRKDMTFEEAVRYFKERVPVTAAKFYAIAEEYRGRAPTSAAADTRERLKSASKATGRSVSNILEEIAIDWLEKNNM